MELNSSYFLACYYLREMRRYNWGRVVVRIALASALAAFYAVAAHSGRSVWPPRICNGGFADAIEFVLGLSAAMLVIEGLHWGTWWMRQLSNVSRAKSQKSVDDSPSLAAGSLHHSEGSRRYYWLRLCWTLYARISAP